jgi:hypothetical protein
LRKSSPIIPRTQDGDPDQRRRDHEKPVVRSGPPDRDLGVGGGGENNPVDLARISWLTTVFVLLIAVVILALQGYAGYAGVTLAVAISAAINLR